MSDDPVARILRFVRRARARLEAVRLLRGAARGTLVGGVAGVVVMLVMKLLPMVTVVYAWPWFFVGAGALAGVAHALARERISTAAAALFLDQQLRTQERIATVSTRPSGPFVRRVAAELAEVRQQPRLPFPREAAIVPLAVFLVFATGLLPAVGAHAAVTGAHAALIVETAAAPGPGAGVVTEVGEETLRDLERGVAPGPRRTESLREAIEGGLHRPEDRRTAREALERALGGDGEAAKALAQALRAREGGRGATDADTGPAAPPRAKDDGTGGVVQVSAYPEAEAFLRQYRRALAEEEGK